MGYGANGTTWFSSELKGRTHTKTTLKSPFSSGKSNSQIIVSDWGDKVDSGIGLSYRPARLHRLAGLYDNPYTGFNFTPQ
jgi:hypothetical protein